MAEKTEIRLQDLIPTSSEFYLAQTGKTYHLEPCTGDKLLQMERDMGGVSELLANVDAESTCRVALLLMKIEDAENFRPQPVKTFDVETGETKEEKTGGYRLLMKCITGLQEQYNIYKAVLISMGYPKEKAEKVIERLISGLNDLVNEAAGDLKKKITS